MFSKKKKIHDKMKIYQNYTCWIYCFEGYNLRKYNFQMNLFNPSKGKDLFSNILIGVKETPLWV
jgi:Pyruvate/2-oxoacid:ferredoxin oxidoreductase delta subunit